ncbi:hypothetical protein BC938DRAFT_481255 [Jimgerdemannia flammicorona]|uniref:Uncharacterized protein n=1 Tax=Jimgerdemannia flammicorona TaxID=994334 RepID=A0A433QGT4_9FUNG|nr:hypothetical protein BC938DRAFT_481255 [Jimgerdemannia flammicorona]
MTGEVDNTTLTGPRFKGGDVLLAEDTTGRGPKSKDVGDGVRRLAFVALDVNRLLFSLIIAQHPEVRSESPGRHLRVTKGNMTGIASGMPSDPHFNMKSHLAANLEASEDTLPPGWEPRWSEIPMYVLEAHVEGESCQDPRNVPNWRSNRTADGGQQQVKRLSISPPRKRKTGIDGYWLTSGAVERSLYTGQMLL